MKKCLPQNKKECVDSEVFLTFEEFEVETFDEKLKKQKETAEC